MTTPKPASKARAGFLLKAAFEALDEAGGSLPLREVQKEVEKRVTLDIDDWHVYEKSGYTRWKSVMHFYSIDCVKAGFLRKSGGRWHLTPEGRAVMKLSAQEIVDQATKAYKEWKAQRVAAEAEAAPEAESESVTPDRALVLETAESQARQEIDNYFAGLGPYEVQDIVAALLFAMGYSIPFVAQPGPDGGTDVLAYPDPLGAKTPHIRVQVKHRKENKATREARAAQRVIIRPDREIGLFFSTAGFTKDAIREANNGAVHIQLLDLDGFLDLWIEHYNKMDEEERSLMRLRPVFFLAPD